MKESTVVLEWLEEGRAEGQVSTRRATVLELLEARFGTVPADVTGLVQNTADIDTLKRWLAAAGKANTLAEFRAAAGV